MLCHVYFFRFSPDDYAIVGKIVVGSRYVAAAVPADVAATVAAADAVVVCLLYLHVP